MLEHMAKFFGSQTALREANRATLLDRIHRSGAMTQIEIAEATGLSTATVSTLVRQLVDEGKLVTQNTTRNGRRATLVALARREGLGIGLAIARRELRLAVIDYAKTIIAEHVLPLARGHKTDTTLERAMVLIHETMSNIGAAPEEIKGIGVAVSAPVDHRTQTIAVPGILPGWDGVDLIGPFHEAFHVPVTVDNDSNCAAICEGSIGAARGKNNFICVDTSDGVGAGIMIDGHLMRGVTGLAGEIGHIQVDPLGSICSCGNRGCLNTVVDEQRLVSLLTVTHGNMTLDDLVSMANEGDPGCRRVIADAAVRIGTVAADLCIAVDPEEVIVSGQLALAAELFTEPFQQALQRLLFPDAVTPMQVLTAQYPASCSALGAAMDVLEFGDKQPHS
jgi:predicted NBD/HSP70 family sugar kinase